MKRRARWGGEGGGGDERVAGDGAACTSAAHLRLLVEVGLLSHQTRELANHAARRGRRDALGEVDEEGCELLLKVAVGHAAREALPADAHHLEDARVPGQPRAGSAGVGCKRGRRHAQERRGIGRRPWRRLWGECGRGHAEPSAAELWEELNGARWAYGALELLKHATLLEAKRGHGVVRLDAAHVVHRRLTKARHQA